MKQTLIVCIGLLLSFESYGFSYAYNISNNHSGQAEMIIPFRLIKKMIVIQAYIDGKKGNFIVDTGTEKMIINERYKVGHLMPNREVTDFGGTRISFKENLVTFGWERTIEQNYQVRITSLSNLEEIMGIPIMGYIGYEVLESYEILFDYQQLEIHLFKLNKKGEWYIDSYLQNKREDSIALYDNEFMPYLKIKFDDQVLKFGIDTGASIHLLRKGSQKKILSYFRSLPPRLMAGFSGRRKVSTAGVIVNMSLEDLPFLPMNCIVESMVELNSTLPKRLDGLLGFEFLSHYKMSINYRKRKLYIWEADNL